MNGYEWARFIRYVLYLDVHPSYKLVVIIPYTTLSLLFHMCQGQNIVWFHKKKRRFSLINEVAVLFTTFKESPMKGCMTILLH